MGGPHAPARYRHRRQLTAVTADSEQRSVRTADGRTVCSTEPPSTSSSCDADTGSVQTSHASRSEQSRFSEEFEGRLCNWFIRQSAAAGYRYDDNVTTAVSCQRRCRRRRHRLQHVNVSMSHHVSRTSARRRVVSRRCSVVVDRRQVTDVTSGDDVTMASATDSESTRLDHAFLVDDWNNDDGSVVKWQPDLSRIAAAPAVTSRRSVVERTAAEDSSRNPDTVAQSTVSFCTASPLRLPTTASDTVSFAFVVRHTVTLVNKT